METKVYETEQGQWVLEWRAPSMQGPAVFKYSTKKKAKEAEGQLIGHRPDQIY